jgi:hypothetical protein
MGSIMAGRSLCLGLTASDTTVGVQLSSLPIYLVAKPRCSGNVRARTAMTLDEFYDLHVRLARYEGHKEGIAEVIVDLLDQLRSIPRVCEASG